MARRLLLTNCVQLPLLFTWTTPQVIKMDDDVYLNSGRLLTVRPRGLTWGDVTQGVSPGVDE